MFRAIFAAFFMILFAGTASAGRLFVACKGTGSIQVYNTATDKLEFEVKDLGEPHQVAVTPDGRYAFTGDAKGPINKVFVIDVQKKGVAESLKIDPLIMPHGILLNHAGTKLYITAAPNRSMAEMTFNPLKVQRTFSFFAENVENMAITPDDKFLFGASNFDGNAAVVDLTKGEFERMIKTGDGSEGLAVSPDGKEIWVANRVSQTIAVLDMAERKRVAEIRCVGNPMHVYFSPDGSQAYVTLAVADRLAIFDYAKRAEIDRFEIGDFPIEMAFSENGGPAYVTNGVAGNVSVVDIPARKVLRRFAVGSEPEGIAYSPK